MKSILNTPFILFFFLVTFQVLEGKSYGGRSKRKHLQRSEDDDLHETVEQIMDKMAEFKEIALEAEEKGDTESLEKFASFALVYTMTLYEYLDEMSKDPKYSKLHDTILDELELYQDMAKTFEKYIKHERKLTRRTRGFSLAQLVQSASDLVSGTVKHVIRTTKHLAGEAKGATLDVINHFYNAIDGLLDGGKKATTTGLVTSLDEIRNVEKEHKKGKRTNKRKLKFIPNWLRNLCVTFEPCQAIFCKNDRKCGMGSR